MTPEIDAYLRAHAHTPERQQGPLLAELRRLAPDLILSRDTLRRMLIARRVPHWGRVQQVTSAEIADWHAALAEGRSRSAVAADPGLNPRRWSKATVQHYCKGVAPGCALQRHVLARRRQIAALWQQGHTIPQIARATSLTAQTVRDNLRREGVPREQRHTVGERRPTPAEVEVLRQRLAAGESAGRLALELGVCFGAVRRLRPSALPSDRIEQIRRAYAQTGSARAVQRLLHCSAVSVVQALGASSGQLTRREWLTEQAPAIRTDHAAGLSLAAIQRKWGIGRHALRRVLEDTCHR